jgi:hypothetical protein
MTMLAHGLLVTIAAAEKSDPTIISIKSLSQNPINDSRGQLVGWNHSTDAGFVKSRHHHKAMAMLCITR